MTDCLFHLGDDGLWVCQWCNRKHPRTTENPPHRNCPSAPGAKEAAKAHLLAEIQALASDGRLPRPMSDVAATVESCFGGCEHLVGNVCQLRGSGCKKRLTWIEFIACRPCPHETEGDR